MFNSKIKKTINMKTVKLTIRRDKAIVGAAMPYRIVINGAEVGKYR